MAADVLVTPSTDGGRVSRYRSVRKAHQQSREPAPPLPTANMANMADSQSLSRSASRYRRPKTTVDRTVPMPTPLSPTQVAALSAHSRTRPNPTDEVPPLPELVPPVIAPRTQESSERL